MPARNSLFVTNTPIIKQELHDDAARHNFLAQLSGLRSFSPMLLHRQLPLLIYVCLLEQSSVVLDGGRPSSR